MPASSDSAVDSELEAALYAAIEAGELPNTELSKLVFKNSMRFPDAIVLTRVGKFYEVRVSYSKYSIDRRMCSPTSLQPSILPMC